VNIAGKWPRPKAMAVRKIIEKLDLCACGSDAHWECVLELLSEAENHTGDGFYRDKWFEFGAKVLDSWGLTEHGTGIGWAWLTDDGKLLLEFLRDFGVEDHDWNTNTGHPAWVVEFSWTEREDPNLLDTYAEWEETIPS
jgi:hypothetical protein